LVITLAVAFQSKFLADGVLALRLVEGKDGFRGKVLIHPHIVFEKLVARGAGEDEEVVAVFEEELVGEHRAGIGRLVVHADGSNRPRLRVVASVGKCALVGIIRRKRIGRREMRRETPLESQPSAYNILFVGLFAGIFIGEIAVCVVVIDAGREADLLAQQSVVRGLGFDLPVVSRR